jgi:spermidine synthase
MVSGAASFAYEVLWTRMLSHVLGGSLYAFAVMVASFLAGIAAGSGLATFSTRSRAAAQAAFIVCQLAIAACSIAVYLLLDQLLPQHAGLRGNVLLSLLVLLPAAVFIGATYPLAVRILVNEPAAAAHGAARVYAWNTVGAIAGALLAGFVLIPALRFEGAMHVTVLCNVAIALLASLLLARPAWKWSVAAAAGLAASAFLFQPQIPRQLLATSPLNVTSRGELRFYDVGRSASVIVLERDGSLLLRTNGLPEAAIDVAGTAPKFTGESWLSPLAAIARPGIESMLIVGYGGGSVIDGAPPQVRRIDVIELEPAVLDANRAISTLRARDPSLDPRVNVVLNDARAALALTSRTYDAIVSQPSHPWTAGASHLYTREFMEQARDHLAPGGVFVQWMNVGFIDESLLRSLAATLLEVFGQVRIYRPDPSTLVFLASREALEPERSLARTGVPLSHYPRHYARFGINTHEDLVAALVADQAGVMALARGAPPITDNLNRMATAGAYDRGTGLTAESTSRVLALYDPLQRTRSWVFSTPGFPVSTSYLARRLAVFKPIDPGVSARLRRIARQVANSSEAAYVNAIAQRTEGEQRSAQRLLQEALQLDPRNEAARFELIRPFLPLLIQGKAPAEVAALAQELPPSAAAVIVSGEHAVASEWAKIPPLDGQLRASGWTDAWHLESVQARAEWRTRVTTPEYRARLGREALAIIDEAIVSQPTPAMFALRARAALAADRPDVLLESLQGFATGTVAIGAPDARGVAQLRGSFDALLTMLDGIANDERVRATRRDAVRAAILEAKRELVGK